MTGPLSGLKVVQLTSLAPGPFACMVLADLGAEVIRVDRAGGEGFFGVPTGYLDRGQKSIAVNMKSPEGVEVVLSLIEDTDILVEGFRPGVTERLGIGPEDCWKRNPGLIYGRLTGYGQDGPMSQAAGHDINYISLAGALAPIGMKGERPIPPLNIVADFAGGGFLLVIGVLAALQERQVSGRGQVVDAAMVDGAAYLTTFFYAMRSAGLWQDQRGANWFDSGSAFYDTYECADGGYVSIGSLEPQFYAALLEGLGLDEADLPSPFDLGAAETLRWAFADVFKTKTRDEWVAHFEGLDACLTPVLNFDDAHKHPHNLARGTFIEVEGRLQPAPAPRFSRSKITTPEPAPQVGSDTDSILKGLGMSPEQIAQLRESGDVA